MHHLLPPLPCRRMYVDICEAKGVSVVDQAQLEKRAQENWR